MTYGRRQDHSIFVFSILTAASLGGLLLLPALPRDQSCHLFGGDYRPLSGIFPDRHRLVMLSLAPERRDAVVGPAADDAEFAAIL
jgi:hypothetical protein